MGDGKRGQSGRRRRVSRATVGVIALTAVMVAPGPHGSFGVTTAWAAPSQADRETARKLAGEAMDLFAAGDYAAAHAKFAEADGLVPAPTLKLRMARCLDKLDRLQEAAAIYREVIAYELDRFAPAVHRQARKQAVPELAALLEQVPSVVVSVEGPDAGAARVTIDGEPFPDGELGQEHPIDPGVYRFEARVGDRVVTETVDLARGETERVALALPMSPEPDPVPGSAPGGDPSEEGVGPFVVAGWTAIGIGGAGLIVGGATGIAMLSKQGGLEERCEDRRCPPDAHDDAREFNRLRVTTTVGLVVGGLGAGVGLTLLLLAPEPDRGDAVSVRPFISPFGGGMVGTF